MTHHAELQRLAEAATPAERAVARMLTAAAGHEDEYPSDYSRGYATAMRRAVVIVEQTLALDAPPPAGIDVRELAQALRYVDQTSKDRDGIALEGPPPEWYDGYARAVLARLAPQPTGDPLSPQWEACSECGGDHWTKDHRDR